MSVPPGSYFRRSLLRQVVGAAVLGLTAACTPQSSQPPLIASPATPKSGGALDVALLRPILNTVPYPASQFIFGWAVFDPLVSLDAHRQPVPSLVEAWLLSDDRRSLTLRLRQGVRFHTGRVFTAEDAKWNIDFVRDPRNGAAAGGELRTVVARVINGTQLELQFDGPMPHIFSLLAGVWPGSAADPASRGIGTGPFRIDAFTPWFDLQLVRNPHYWRSDRPYLDSIRLRTLGDAASAVVALQAEAVGLAQCAPSDVAQLTGGTRTRCVVLAGSGKLRLRGQRRRLALHRSSRSSSDRSGHRPAALCSTAHVRLDRADADNLDEAVTGVDSGSGTG